MYIQIIKFDSWVPYGINRDLLYLPIKFAGETHIYYAQTQSS